MADDTAWEELFTHEHLQEYQKPKPDTKARDQRRAKAAASIDTALKQFKDRKDGKPAPGRRWSINDERVSYRPHMGSKPWVAKGREVLATAIDSFEQAMGRLKAAIAAGLHDDDLEAASTAEPTHTSPRAPAKRTRSAGTGLGNKAHPDDAEWMAKFRAKHGEPDASIKDPVPNSKGTKWVAKANMTRGQKAKGVI